MSEEVKAQIEQDTQQMRAAIVALYTEVIVPIIEMGAENAVYETL
jgi:hypothetical protein